MKKTFLLFVSFLFVNSLFSQKDGTLDPSFGTNGQVRTCNSNDVAGNRLIIQNDDKIVVGGSLEGAPELFLLARYNIDGNLDSNFGINGIVTTEIAGGGSSEILALALQPDNKIVAGGHTGPNFALVRYNSNGSLDTTFGVGGIVDDTSNNGLINDLAIQTDGKIVAVGATSVADFNAGGLIVRYNPNGTLDTTFNGTGIVDVSGLILGSTIGLNAVNIQNDGKIVAVGTTENDSNVNGLFIARYLPTGAIDTSFSDNGFDTQLVGTDTQGRDVVVLYNDKILALAQVILTGPNQDAALFQYSSNGVLDFSFGTNGVATFNMGSGTDNPKRLAIQSDSKILVAATNNALNTFNIRRRMSDGSSDASFAQNGIALLNILGGVAAVSDLAINSQGKIIASGSTNSDPDCMALAQLEVNSLHYSKTSQAAWQAYYNQNVKV